MSFAEAVQKGIEIVRLDRAAIREAAAEPLAFAPALLIAALSGLAMWPFVFRFAFHGLVTGPLLGLALLFLGGLVFHFLASLFDGHGDYVALLRVWGLSRVLGWLWVIPFVGLVIDLWSFVVAVVVLEELYGLKRTQAVLAVALPLLALFVLTAIFLFNLVVLGGLLSLGRFS